MYALFSGLGAGFNAKILRDIGYEISRLLQNHGYIKYINGKETLFFPAIDNNKPINLGEASNQIFLGSRLELYGKILKQSGLSLVNFGGNAKAEPKDFLYKILALKLVSMANDNSDAFLPKKRGVPSGEVILQDRFEAIVRYLDRKIKSDRKNGSPDERLVSTVLIAKHLIACGCNIFIDQFRNIGTGTSKYGVQDVRWILAQDAYEELKKINDYEELSGLVLGSAVYDPVTGRCIGTIHDSKNNIITAKSARLYKEVIIEACESSGRHLSDLEGGEKSNKQILDYINKLVLRCELLEAMNGDDFNNYKEMQDRNNQGNLAECDFDLFRIFQRTFDHLEGQVRRYGGRSLSMRFANACKKQGQQRVQAIDDLKEFIAIQLKAEFA